MTPFLMYAQLKGFLPSFCPTFIFPMAAGWRGQRQGDVLHVISIRQLFEIPLPAGLRRKTCFEKGDGSGGRDRYLQGQQLRPEQSGSAASLVAIFLSSTDEIINDKGAGSVYQHRFTGSQCLQSAGRVLSEKHCRAPVQDPDTVISPWISVCQPTYPTS